jgi:hypothetical protein
MINRFDDREAIERVVAAEGSLTSPQMAARATALWRRVEKAVAEHPKQSLIAALAAGAVIGWITKRR